MDSIHIHHIYKFLLSQGWRIWLETDLWDASIKVKSLGRWRWSSREIEFTRVSFVQDMIVSLAQVFALIAHDEDGGRND